MPSLCPPSPHLAPFVIQILDTISYNKSIADNVLRTRARDFTVNWRRRTLTSTHPCGGDAEQPGSSGSKSEPDPGIPRPLYRSHGYLPKARPARPGQIYRRYCQNRSEPGRARENRTLRIALFQLTSGPHSVGSITRCLCSVDRNYRGLSSCRVIQSTVGVRTRSINVGVHQRANVPHFRHRYCTNAIALL